MAISLSRTLSICVVTVVAVNVSVEIPFVTSSPLSTIKPPSNLIRNCVSSGAVLDRYESFKESIAASSSCLMRKEENVLSSVGAVLLSVRAIIRDFISNRERRDENTLLSDDVRPSSIFNTLRSTPPPFIGVGVVVLILTELELRKYLFRNE